MKFDAPIVGQQANLQQRAGSGALTWSAEWPKRRGLWWVERPSSRGIIREKMPVVEYGGGCTELIVCLGGGQYGLEGASTCDGWRFAGPLPERDETMPVEPRQNDEDMQRHGSGASPATEAPR